MASSRFYVDFTLGFKSKLSLLDSRLSEFRKLAQLSCSSIKLKIGSPFFMQSFPKISLEVPVPVPVQVQAKVVRVQCSKQVGGAYGILVHQPDKEKKCRDLRRE